MSFKNILLIKPHKGIVAAYPVSPIAAGLEYIAAYIQNYVNKVDIVDLAKDSKSLEYHIKRLKPDLIGININFSTDHNESLEIAKIAKSFGSSVAAGGYHATGLAEELAGNPNIDFVVRGEGEETMLELIKKGSAEGVKGVSYSTDCKVIHNEDRPPIIDIDSIPYPARHLRKNIYRSAFFASEFDYIMTSRGCWGKCKFCCEHMMCKGIQRYRKPENIMNEIEYILNFHKGKELLISIFDPNFGGNPIIAEELCDRLIEFRSNNNFDFHFMVNCRVDVLSTRNILVNKMSKAGMDLVVLGLESPQKEHLELMNKFTTREMQEKAINNIHNNNGDIIGTFCIGFPYQNKQDILNCCEYAKNLKLALPVFGIATPLPGSDLYNELKLKDHIIENDWDKYDYFNLVFKHDFLNTDWLRKSIFSIWIYFYNDLTLNDEYRKLSKRNRKRRLYIFAIKISVVFNILFSIIKSEDLSDVNSYLNNFINPNLKLFTNKIGFHNIYEMSRFLKILGKQIIQITANFKNESILSWVIKTNNKEVEYIDSIPGAIDNASIVINLYTENTFKASYLSSFKIINIIVKDMLKDNKGIKAKFNLFRLFVAIALEFIVYKFDNLIVVLNFNLSRMKNNIKHDAF